MAYLDSHDREMAKWAHDRLARQRQANEESQRRELGRASIDSGVE